MNREIKLETDFYNALPGIVCFELDDYWRRNYSTQDWFHKAWEEYRQHVKTSTMDDVRMPGFVFNKYINSTVSATFTKPQNY